MSRRILVALLLAGALLPVPGAMAGHMSTYALVATERDDQGRGIEPDNLATGVLGPQVVNKVYDPTRTGLGARADPFPNPLGPPPPGHSPYINPGCTGDDGRKIGGQCGLWTVGVGSSYTDVLVPRKTIPPPVSEDGRCQEPGPISHPPGRYSGDSCPGEEVMFLDAVARVDTSSLGVTMFEVNRKVDDTALAATVLGQDFLVGPMDFWAWYGVWQDKNGNGVVDSYANFNEPQPGGGCVAPCDGEPVAIHFPEEEFRWLGNCRKADDSENPNAIRSGYCSLDVEARGGITRMLGWFYPGSHHAYCGGSLDPLDLTCSYVPADIPGRQVIHFTGAVGLPAPCYSVVGIFCETNLANFDRTDEDFLGDPLLGPQGGVRPDQEFGDRTGEPELLTRHWVYGEGWATYFYDQSILQTMVMVTAVGCEPGGPNEVLLGTCRFVDVDRYEAWNSLADQLLTVTVKPAARGNWVFVRDAYLPLSREVDAVTANRALNTAPLTGPLDDGFVDPGYGREPNDPRDKFPGAAHNTRGCSATPENGFQDGEALHRGWCNDYAAHRQGPRAFADLQELRVLHENRPVTVNTLQVLSVSGVVYATTMNPEAPAGSPLPVQRADGDHRRTLGPGKYIFSGVSGTWHDQPHAWSEDVFMDLPELGIVGGDHVNPPDGWVGNLVENLGTWYYRGYADEDCGATDQPAWSDINGDGTPEGHSYAECRPYLDGDVTNPQGYGLGDIESPTSRVTEWRGGCSSVGVGGNVAPPAGRDASRGVVTLTPLDGTWDAAPILVWREHFSGIRVRTTSVPPAISGAEIVDLTGTRGPIELGAACSVGSRPGGITVGDLLILPLGNLGEAFTATITVQVGAESVTDTDAYAAIGLA